MTIAPLAIALRQIRHGRVALAEGWLHTAIVCLDSARIWLTKGYQRLQVMGRCVRPDLGGGPIFESHRARSEHYRARVLFVQRVVDSFAVGVALAATPGDLPGKSGRQ